MLIKSQEKICHISTILHQTALLIKSVLINLIRKVLLNYLPEPMKMTPASMRGTALRARRIWVAYQLQYQSKITQEEVALCLKLLVIFLPIRYSSKWQIRWLVMQRGRLSKSDMIVKTISIIILCIRAQMM